MRNQKRTLKSFTIVLLLLCIISTLFLYAPNGRISADTTPNAKIINCNQYVNMRDSATDKANIVAQVPLGTRVTVTETVTAVAGDGSGSPTWYKIEVIISGVVKTGFVCGKFVQMDAGSVPIQDAAFEASIASFPESYKPYLRSLHIEHPSWVFVAENTGLSWSDVLNMETASGKSLIQSDKDPSWISQSFLGVVDSPNWVNASRAIVAYYMDPRNQMTNNGIFQFLDLHYQTGSASIGEGNIEPVLAGSFMGDARANYGNGDAPIFYRQIFAIAQDASQINGIFLAARALQECGSRGSSSSNGTSGVYNFYNIGAYSSVLSASRVGLEFARLGLDPAFNSCYNIPWNTPGLSIVNGARWINDYYVSKGQDTIYYMRFNVASDSATSDCTHQYMTATQSAYSEAVTMYNAYSKSGILNSALTFCIPVYSNMPSEASPLPTSTNCYDAFVTFLFDKTLGRAPSSAELVERSTQLSNGKEAVDMIVEFITSAEFNARGLTDSQFIDLMYQLLLGRNVEADGLATHLNTLAFGYSRMTVYANIANSQECLNYLGRYSVRVGSYTSDDNVDLHMSYRPFVVSLYENFFGRTIDTSGTRNWISQLGAGVMSGPQVAAALSHSTEFTSHNYTDEEFITALYRVCLGREPDSAGLQDWMNRLAAHYSRDYVLAGFVNSQEFAGICNGYGISTAQYTGYRTFAPAPVDSVKVNEFVTRLYTIALGRNPETEGLNYWTSQLVSGSSTGDTVAHGVFFSVEFNNLNVSNEQYVRMLYLIFLNREPDTAGYNDWMSRLNSGASRLDVYNGFVNAPEFINVCFDSGFYPNDSYRNM